MSSLYFLRVITGAIFAFLTLLFADLAHAQTAPKTYIVQKGDNISTIAKKFKTTTAEIKKLNQLKDDKIQVGQVLMLNTSVETKIVNTSGSGGSVYHTVQNGESLYGIARKFKVSTDSLKAWNKLANNIVKTGTKLLVNKSGYTGSTITVNPSLRMISEKGMAAMVGTNTPSTKKMALHRKAPVGSMITVANPSNGESVLVEVIGNEIDDERVVVKLSRSACKELGALSEIFNVVVHYAKPKDEQ